MQHAVVVTSLPTETDDRHRRRPDHFEDEILPRISDELDLIAAVVEDVEDESIRDRITMWIDYEIYRALHESGEEAGAPLEMTRQCRQALAAHLDAVALEVESDDVAREFACSTAPAC